LEALYPDTKIFLTHFLRLVQL